MLIQMSGSVRACGLKLIGGLGLILLEIVRLRASLWVEISIPSPPCDRGIVRLRASLWVEIKKAAQVKTWAVSGSVRACGLKYSEYPEAF